jgi:two-component system, response regulator PdtaR
MRQPRVRILIVEDEALIALCAAEALEEAGYEIAGIAADMPEALRLAAAERPDAALVDLRLKDGLTGLQLTHQLYQRYGTVCILLTAYPRELWSGCHGAWARVRKPYSAETLGLVIEYCRALAAGRKPDGSPPCGVELLS